MVMDVTREASAMSRRELLGLGGRRSEGAQDPEAGPKGPPAAFGRLPDTGARAPEVHYDPGFLDALVFHLREHPGLTAWPPGASERGAAALAQHEVDLDRIYRRPSGDRRRRDLDRANARLAAAVGIGEVMLGAVRALPEVDRRVHKVVVAHLTAGDERVDAHVPDAAGRITLIAWLALSTWFDGPQRARLLRHELTHVQDMVDPRFAYDPDAAWPGDSRVRQLAARRRFTLLWCASVDGRLAAAGGVGPLAPPEEYARELSRACPGVGGEEAAGVVAAVQGRASIPHRELLEMAGGLESRTAAGGRMAGGLCPLCGFPTCEWAPETVPDREADAVAVDARIAADFPTWTRAQGCCLRCLEGYDARAQAGKSS
jgi:hypothetical protein